MNQLFNNFNYGVLSLAAMFLLALAIFIPSLWIPVLVVNFIYGSYIYYLRIKYLPKANSFYRNKKIRRNEGQSNENFFFSIHVPICREPVEITIKTLQCLAEIDYKNYEVIVLSNNTSDKSLWEPVRDFCESSDRMHFYHYDKLPGFKAGALNVSLKLVAPHCDVIMTVDADYCVRPNILKIASSYLEKYDYIQFPQAYRNCGPEGFCLNEDFAHFFKIYMQEANAVEVPLLTGTLTFIKKSALDEIGGWCHSSITEDAQTGLLLIDCGYKGAYIHEIVGHGLMPDDLNSLRKQRQRWAFGNAEVLKYFLLTKFPFMKPRQKVSVLLQLTAWHDFLLIPILALISLSISILIGHGSDQLALYCILLSFVSFFLLKYLFFSLKLKTMNLLRVSSLFFMQQGLFWESNLSWQQAFLGKNLRFKRTSKFKLKTDNRSGGSILVICAVLLVSSFIYFWQQELVIGYLTLIESVILVISQYLLYKTFKQVKEPVPV